MTKYYQQPGDEHIKFDLPLTLEEIKQLHLYTQAHYQKGLDKGHIYVPAAKMLKKLDELINYLQKEHYENL